MGLNWKVLFLNINFVKTEIMMARILNFTERTSHKNPCFETRPGILAGCLTILQLWNGGGEKGENASEKTTSTTLLNANAWLKWKREKKKNGWDVGVVLKSSQPQISYKSEQYSNFLEALLCQANTHSYLEIYVL